MPAAAVIPAPIAYIKVVAVKKLVVEFLARAAAPASRRVAATAPSSGGTAPAFTGRRRDTRPLL